MKIGGFHKFSLIDYEGKISAIIFTQGCNFRCPFCHNPELVIPELFANTISFDEIQKFLEKRKGIIDAVEFTGGEPLLQDDIAEKIMQIKEMGFLIKLDTNGSLPEILSGLTELVDYIAMDIKAPLEDYSEIAKATIDKTKLFESIEIIKNKAKDYEFRTTLIKGYHNEERIQKMALTINGAKRYFLQKPHFSRSIVDPDFKLTGDFSDSELKRFKEIAAKYVKETEIR